MIISLSGKPGSGKSSVGKVLSKKLSMKRYYMGQIQRDIAKKEDMTINELGKLEEEDDTIDRMIEAMVEKLGKEEDNFIIETRTATKFIPHSIKIFIDVNIDNAAKRIFNEPEENKEKRNEAEYKTVEDVKKDMLERENSEKKRFKEYYDIDIFDKKNYDFVIDSTGLTIQETVDKILEFVKNKG